MEPSSKEEAPDLMGEESPFANIPPISGFIKPVGSTVSTVINPEPTVNELGSLAPATEGGGGNEDQQNQGSGQVPSKGAKFRYFTKHGLGFNPDNDATMKGPKKRKKKKGIQFDVADPIDVMIKKARLSSDKNAVQLLNETAQKLNQVLEFHFEEPEGATHEAIFTVSTIFPSVGGKMYVGKGRSKKQAKINLAEMMLDEMRIPYLPSTKPDVEMNAPSKAPSVPPHYNQDYSENMPYQPETYQDFSSAPTQILVDFSSDDVIMMPDEDLRNIAIQNQTAKQWEAFCFKRLKKTNIIESPLLALNSLVESECSFVFPDPDQTAGPFEVYLTCKGKEFVGYGPSKKGAKADGARRALLDLLGPELYEKLASYVPPKGSSKSFEGASEEMSYEDSPKAGLQESNGDTELNIAFSTTVENMIRDKYNEIMKDDEEHWPNKVLAGIVMTTGSPLIENCQVIAVSTGTKCLDGDCMSESGLALNDCHAEILSNRCLRDYIYSQLDELVQPSRTSLDERMGGDVDEKMKENEQIDAENSIFDLVKNEEERKEGRGFVLKPGIKFHLFISTSPCGDARIFSPKGIEGDEVPDDIKDSHPNRINRGVLRAKIEAGEGTIPVCNLQVSGTQTWDAILSGNALHTMSCSDKICRWNVLGFQGALLSLLTGPIYYSSIILGSLHHPIHLKRALIDRISPVKTLLIPPWIANEPKLLMTQNEEKRVVKKSPNHAIVWRAGWKTHEVIQASKGRCASATSRVSKRLSYMRFLNLFMNKSGYKEDYLRMTYHNAKMLAKDFQANKKFFEEVMKEQNFGHWISKPIEQDNFTPN